MVESSGTTIHSDQRCKVCGRKFRDNHKDALVCEYHPDEKATGFVVRFGRKLTKRFREYKQASRFLTGLRFEVDQGKFDIRDYQVHNPLGFAHMVEDYLETKRTTKSLKKIEQRLNKAVISWENRNIKTISYRDIEKLRLSLIDDGLSTKYIKDILDALRTFFRWALMCGDIEKIPEFPEHQYSMRRRRIVDKRTQDMILEEIFKIYGNFNARVYIGVKWLATYVNLRPEELRNIKERDIDLDMGMIIIQKPKEREPKVIYLIDDDIELVRCMPKGFPKLYFFRHEKGNGAAKPGQQFGKDYLYNCWKTACKSLGIDGVDLYGGTRHSSVVDLRKRHTPETVIRAMGTKTRKAWERYLQATGDELRPLYADTRADTPVINIEKVGE